MNSLTNNQLFSSIILLFMMFSINSTYARHIIGGDVHYTFQGYNNNMTTASFEVSITIYRDGTDPQVAFFDNFSDFGIYGRNNAGEWEFFDDIIGINFRNYREIEIIDDPCIQEPEGIRVDMASYVFQIELPLDGRDYLVTYQRCCRNNTITNILLPGDQGSVWQIEITSDAILAGNNSPRFRELPPLFVCEDQALNYDHSAEDDEGNLIVYSFCSPLSSGGARGGGCCNCVRPDPENCPPATYSTLSYRSPFSASNPIGGNPIVTIDEATGQVSGTPNNSGQYVVGVCIEEYDSNGNLLSRSNRDFQFNILPCETILKAELDAEIDEDGNFVISSCGPREITINNISSVGNVGQNYRWLIWDENDDLILNELNDNSLTNLQFEFPDYGSYALKLIINEGLTCKDSVSSIVNLYPNPRADFEIHYDSCRRTTTDFVDVSVFRDNAPLTDWIWNLENNSIKGNEIGYSFENIGLQTIEHVIIDENDCSDTLAKMLHYDPEDLSIELLPSHFIACDSTPISFRDESTGFRSDRTYTSQFTTNQSVFNTLDTSIIYPVPGKYDFQVEYTTSEGCVINRFYPGLLEIIPKPNAVFEIDDSDLSNFNPTVQFINKSQDHISSRWDIETDIVFDEAPLYSFRDTGLYNVLLTVFHENSSCPDTMSRTIDVMPLVKVVMPDAFTPNGDGKNEELRPVGYFDGIQNYTLDVYNRWGANIFSSSDINIGWKGYIENSFDEAQQGSYTYKIGYTLPRGERVEQDGRITLIR